MNDSIVMEATQRLIDAHNEMAAAVRDFEDNTGCGVCSQSYIQLAGRGKITLELAELLGKAVTDKPHDDEYTHHEFVYQDIKFLWLEEK